MSTSLSRRPVHALHARIASQTDVLALETERMIDGLAVEIDRRFAFSINGIAERLAALAASPGFAGRYGAVDVVKRLLLAAIQATRAEMFQQFARLAAWRQRATASVLSRTLPPDWLARAAAYRRTRRLREAVALALPDDEPPSRWQELIFPAPTQQTVSRIVMAPARFDGKTWDQRLVGLSKLADDKAAVATQIIQGMTAGEDVAAIRKRIEPLVAGVRSAAQRIARTEARRVAETAQEESWKSLGDLLIGVQFRAVLDERTRPDHRARNGKIIYKDSPQWATRPQLPDAANCRCVYTCVLAEPSALATDPSLRSEFEQSGSLASPDPATYDDWFATASESARRKAVGVQRYNAAANATGGSPSYRDFVTASGDLLSPADISGESSGDRFRRQMEVQALMSLRREQIRTIARQGFIVRNQPSDPFADLLTGPAPARPTLPDDPFADPLSKAPAVDPVNVAIVTAAKQSGKAVRAAERARKAVEREKERRATAKRKAKEKLAAKKEREKAKVAAAKERAKAAKERAKAKAAAAKQEARRKAAATKAERDAARDAERTQRAAAAALAKQQAKLAADARAAAKAAPVAPVAPAAPTLRFPSSKAKASIADDLSPWLDREFGRPVAPSDLASLVGAADDATVSATAMETRTHDGAIRDAAFITVKSPAYQAFRTLFRNGNGQLEIHNDFFGIKSQGTGLGTRIFAQQVEQAAAQGVSVITTEAARSQSLNGYYTWPRMGYNGPIPAKIRAQLPSELSGATDMLDLMSTQAGRDWWKANGVTINLAFDPTPGSRSRRVLDAYLAEQVANGKIVMESALAEMRKMKARGAAEELDLDDDDQATLDAVLDRLAEENGGRL